MSLYIGLDLGGTNLKYGVGDENGKVKIKKIKPSLAQEPSEIIFENIKSAISELIENSDEEIKAIGFGTPGCINFEKGELMGDTPNIKSWTNAPIKKTLEDHFNIPVWVDNDANVMSLAEARIGAAKDYSYVLCVTIGTGIGGGIIIDNNIYRGANFSAAEIGHAIIEFNGKQCNCGNVGCLEAYTAAPAMVERYRKKLKRAGLLFNENQITTEFIFNKADVEEDLAIETINETCDYLGAGIAGLVNILNPQIVVIGGGVADAGDPFISRIKDTIFNNSMESNARDLKVVKAQLGNDAGIVGAILLAAES